MGKGLGELKLESEGLLLLIRPKVYVMFSEAIQKEAECIGDLRQYLGKNLNTLDEGKEIVRFALHGFWGDVKQLLELYVEKGNEYIVQHMVKIREAIRQNKQPRVMETQRRHMKVYWEEERAQCGHKRSEAIKILELCNLDCFNCAYLTEEEK